MKRLLFACLALPLSLFAEGGLPNQPYIYVEGRAEVERSADMVTLRFDLVASNPDQAKANQEVQSKAVKILGMFNERKVAENDVIAADLRSEPQYEGDDEESSAKRGKVIGYTVTRSFKRRFGTSPHSQSWSTNCSRLVELNFPKSVRVSPKRTRCRMKYRQRR